MWDNTAQHFTSLHGIVDAKDNVFSSIRRRARTQNRRLNITYFECGNIVCWHVKSVSALEISTLPSRLRYKDFQQIDIAMRFERIKVYKSRQIQRSSAK